ncbi:uncharacterized protein TNCV_175161 [Trichonephila clavipes]|nr:uncharacterized protein TNCV_175161 [Trichonephila clavipes]
MAIWSDEAHFYLNGTVNTQNCSICVKKNPRIHTKFPLQSPNATVWCGFPATFIHGLFFFEEVGLPDQKECSMVRKKKKRALNHGKNTALTAKELESSSSKEILESKILKMEATNGNKIKQENDTEDACGINADEEKIKQPIPIIKK